MHPSMRRSLSGEVRRVMATSSSPHREEYFPLLQATGRQTHTIQLFVVRYVFFVYPTIVLLYIPWFCPRSPAAGPCASQLFVVRFFYYYCTFVRTFVLCKVTGRRRLHIKVVCGAFLGIVSIKLCYFCTYPFLNEFCLV